MAFAYLWPRGGGVTNTGDATVGDVAAGKTFSSAALTNATGTSTLNATVPGDAPIQPAQAFVDVMTALNTLFNTNTFDFSGKGITSITNFDWLKAPATYDSQAGPLPVSFANNAMDVASIDATLAFLAELNFFLNLPSTLNLSGGTNATPTQNAVVVAGAGTGSVNGSYTQRGTRNGRPYYNLIGQADNPTVSAVTYNGMGWDIADSGGAPQYTGDATNPWDVTWTLTGTGSDPVPTVTSTNGDQATLIAAGWTVTTN